jgi:hypothetical protein
MERGARGDDVALGRTPGARHAGSRAGPVVGRAAEQREAERGRGGGVADPHLAERDQVDALLDGHHPVGHGPRAVVLGHRRAGGEIGGRDLQRQLVDPQIRVDAAADLVHGPAPGDEIAHHLGGHLRWIGRHAARRDPVIAGEDGDARPTQAGRMAVLPGRHPGGELLEPAERACGLGQRRLARIRRGARGRRGGGQGGEERTDLGERGGGARIVGHDRAECPWRWSR